MKIKPHTFNQFLYQKHTGTGSFLYFLCLIICLLATFFPWFSLYLGLLDPDRIQAANESGFNADPDPKLCSFLYPNQ
jgi:hypothetical protein